ncbi:MAG: holo-ACP synthase [Verrucomicrobiaceae bacterium]|nr:holo-ACP synthase [Verrucomicrobiaceae bacterium]
MKLIGIGLDLCEVERMRDLMTRHEGRFELRTFTEGERTYCTKNVDPAMHYAARFAAKEAVAKALGTGFADGVGWSDIEVIRAESGQPSIQLHGSTAQRAKELGAKQIHLTLTHTKDTAAASVVIMG